VFYVGVKLANKLNVWFCFTNRSWSVKEAARPPKAGYESPLRPLKNFAKSKIYSGWIL
jgi:hypothetical protein